MSVTKTLYHCKIINDLVIPENVTNISSFAVCNNYELTNITLADNVTKIEYQVFYKCTWLSDINHNKVALIESYAFYECENITNITVSDSLKSIRHSAFQDCICVETMNLCSKNY